MIRVFHDHLLQGEHTDQEWRVEDNGDLVIVVDGKRYAAGTWHAVGHDIVCGFIDPRPECPNCYSQN